VPSIAGLADLERRTNDLIDRLPAYADEWTAGDRKAFTDLWQDIRAAADTKPSVDRAATLLVAWLSNAGMDGFPDRPA
jgi:hypothetical protein